MISHNHEEPAVHHELYTRTVSVTYTRARRVRKIGEILHAVYYDGRALKTLEIVPRLANRKAPLIGIRTRGAGRAAAPPPPDSGKASNSQK